MNKQKNLKTDKKSIAETPLQPFTDNPVGKPQNKAILQTPMNSEEYYRALFEHTATANMILAEDMTVLFVNENFEKMMGYSKEEVENNNRVINQVVLSSEIAKNIRFLRDIKLYIYSSDYKSAILRLGDVKEFLVSLDVEINGEVILNNSQYITNLGIDIRNIEGKVYQEMKIDEEIILINIETLITFLSKNAFKKKKQIIV